MERNKIVGIIHLHWCGSISNTMSVRFKGLTKTSPKNQNGKMSKLIDSFFSED